MSKKEAKNEMQKGGKNVPLLAVPNSFQDATPPQDTSHVNRLRIPERVIYTKGAGALGYFKVTNDITEYCKAKIFSEIDKQTRVAVRFSMYGGETCSADKVRDIRGFAVKFYTEEGNWDLVGSNTPIFFIRDHLQFPSLSQILKRNPVTNIKDVNCFWEFMTQRPETTHQVLFYFTERSVPNGYRHMHGYGGNTFKLVNEKGKAVYCKFHFKTDQGIECIPKDKEVKIAGYDPDYSNRDLWKAIEDKKYPTWTMYIQVMKFKQVQYCRFNPFDLTQVWPHAEFPLIEVGKLVLNKNPKNAFKQVEQIAFNPANFVPGIEASPDEMLQARLVAYTDAQEDRLGENFMQFPSNLSAKSQQNDLMSLNDQSGVHDFLSGGLGGPVKVSKQQESSSKPSGDVDTWYTLEDNYTQARNFYWKVLKMEDRTDLVNNVAHSLVFATDILQGRAVEYFRNVDPVLAERITKTIKKIKKGKMKKGKKLATAVSIVTLPFF